MKTHSSEWLREGAAHVPEESPFISVDDAASGRVGQESAGSATRETTESGSTRKRNARSARYWDGYVREVVSARHVNASNNNVRVRVELLSCGHEQAFCGNKASHGGGRGAVGSRVCNTCSDMGRREC